MFGRKTLNKIKFRKFPQPKKAKTKTLAIYSSRTHVTLVLEEDFEVGVFSEDGVLGQSAQEDLVHGNRLLENSEVLPAQHFFFFEQILFFFF